ncbi:MAG: hypothetical protein R2752_05705 [Vicinamibacterales bacterium]
MAYRHSHLPVKVAATGALVALSLVLATPARGQALEPDRTFDTLTFLVNLGDRLTVVQSDGRLVRGALVEITLDDLVLDTGGERRRLAAGGIVEVRKRDADPLSNGAARGLLLGAGLGLAGGLVAHHRNGSAPVPYVIFPSAVFAGAGAALDAWRQAEVVVWRASGRGAAPPAATGSRAADALLLRLDLGDLVSVEDAGGRRVRGRLLAVTPDTLVVGVGRDAARRRPSRVATSGASPGAATRSGTGCSSGRFRWAWGSRGASFTEDHERGRGTAARGLMAGLGAGLGAGIDALVARDVDVFRADRPVTVRVTGGPGSVWVVLRF